MKNTIKHTGTLKRPRVEKGMTLEQLSQQTKIPASTLGSYESDDYKEIPHRNIIELAKFYEVSTDYTQFQGEAASDYRNRPEGWRIEFKIKFSSLRIEMTINDPRKFKVYKDVITLTVRHLNAGFPWASRSRTFTGMPEDIKSCRQTVS